MPLDDALLSGSSVVTPDVTERKNRSFSYSLQVLRSGGRTPREREMPWGMSRNESGGKREEKSEMELQERERERESEGGSQSS